MKKRRALEFIFTLVILLFLAALILGMLLGITLAQELSGFEVGFKAKVLFVAGCFTLFLYVMKLIVDKVSVFFKVR